MAEIMHVEEVSMLDGDRELRDFVGARVPCDIWFFIVF